MSLRTVVMASAILLCGSCFWSRQDSGGRAGGDGLTLGEALAQTACPVQVAEANAWINRMPSIGSRNAFVNVSVRLAGGKDTAILTRSGASTSETLVLDVRMSDEAPIPGRMAYREAAGDPVYKRVELACRGAPVFQIEEIEQVF
jgi:hypothetical protein